MANSHRDVVAITQLVNLYGLAVDSRQWHLFDSIFTADVDADYGASSGAQGCRWRPALGRHGLVRRHIGAHPRGWRIGGRICRFTWWTGNPSVDEGIAGVKFDLTTSVVRREADAGRIGVLGDAPSKPDI
jgi:SnoaL-like domain